jgi:hypothetical protein
MWMLMMAVIWDVAPCSMVDIECAVSASETSVSIYYTARRNIPEDSHLHTSCENNGSDVLSAFGTLPVVSLRTS